MRELSTVIATTGFALVVGLLAVVRALYDVAAAIREARR